MSYDTIVNEALDPPVPRVVERARPGEQGGIGRRILRRKVVAPFAIVATSVAVLAGVTLTVARVSPIPVEGTSESVPGEGADLSPSPTERTLRIGVQP